MIGVGIIIGIAKIGLNGIKLLIVGIGFAGFIVYKKVIK
jgi:hypothetical protein